MSETYRVWAIRYQRRQTCGPKCGAPIEETVAVAAESEYGAIKRLCGNIECAVLYVQLTDRKPEWDERRVEGFIDHDFGPDPDRWEYT